MTITVFWVKLTNIHWIWRTHSIIEKCVTLQQLTPTSLPWKDSKMCTQTWAKQKHQALTTSQHSYGSMNPSKVKCWSSIMRHTLVTCPKDFQGPVSSQYQRQGTYNNLATTGVSDYLPLLQRCCTFSITIVSQNRLSVAFPSCTITPPTSSRATMYLPTNFPLLLEFFKATRLRLFSFSSWWTVSVDKISALCKEIWLSESDVFNWSWLHRWCHPNSR